GPRHRHRLPRDGASQSPQPRRNHARPPRRKQRREIGSRNTQSRRNHARPPRRKQRREIGSRNNDPPMSAECRAKGSNWFIPFLSACAVAALHSKATALVHRHPTPPGVGALVESVVHWLGRRTCYRKLPCLRTRQRARSIPASSIFLLTSSGLGRRIAIA